MELFTRMYLGLLTFFIARPSVSGFSITERNSYLANHVIETFFSNDWLRCTFACQGDNMCVSYNYNLVTGSCELNSHGLQTPFTGTDELVKMQGVVFHQIRPATKFLPSRKVEPASQCDCSCTSESACSPGPDSYLPVSCKEIWEKFSRFDGSFYIRADSPHYKAHVFCHMTPISGCGDGGWTLVMKINGNKTTFSYHSPYWNNTVAYNEGGGTSLAEEETKLSSYWSTPFTRLCLGMKYQQEGTNWIALSYSGLSLWDVISNGTYTPTNISTMEWKSLLKDSQLTVGCTKQGFNSDISQNSAKARIGIIGIDLSTCSSPATSRIGFGTGGSWHDMDASNSCGNENQNVFSKKAFGYIFVQ